MKNTYLADFIMGCFFTLAIAALVVALFGCGQDIDPHICRGFTGSEYTRCLKNYFINRYTVVGGEHEQH